MNLEELIKKYLGEWLKEGALVRVEYYYNGPSYWMISFFGGSAEMSYSTSTTCGDIEKGLGVIRERLQKS
jgi:hypothetical protein